MRRIKRHTVGLAKTKQRLEKGASLSSVEMTERRLTFQELMNSEMLFARKFDAKVDSEIVIKIRERLLETNN